jgi:hypothetical protein
MKMKTGHDLIVRTCRGAVAGDAFGELGTYLISN